MLAVCWCYVGVSVVRLSRIDTVPEFSVRRHDSAELSCKGDYMYIPVAFLVILYVVYVVECWHCQTQIELHYKTNVHLVYDYIQALRNAVPIVWWKAVCYHYLRRTRQVTRYRNGDAFTSTQVYYERINSHTACSMYNFSHDGIKDISKRLTSLENHPITKITITKGFSFATIESESEFENQRAQFFQEYECRDDYMETREGLDLFDICFKNNMTVFADSSQSPWYISHLVFWTSSALLLSWPLRILIQYNTAYVHFHVNKLFGCEQCALGHYSYQNQMTRVNTMDSAMLENAIKNNNSIVPSYSEALLMEYDRPNSHGSFDSVVPCSSQRQDDNQRPYKNIKSNHSTDTSCDIIERRLAKDKGDLIQMKHSESTNLKSVMSTDYSSTSARPVLIVCSPTQSYHLIDQFGTECNIVTSPNV